MISDSTKKIIFRADGNSLTGLGHLYRLFSLVETVKNKFNYTFLTQEISTSSVIPKQYNKAIIPKEVDIQDEPEWLAANFSFKEYIIIADGYQFNTKYQKGIKNKGFKLIYIDDLTTEHMYADLVINHSPQVIKENFIAESYTKFALGMDYALLRPNFLKTAKKHQSLQKIDTAFINFGGADKYNLTLKTTETLLKIKQVEFINIVLGAAFKQESIYQLQKEFPNRINIYKDLSEKKLLAIMQSCNIAIVPSSTILFELFCVKMPIYSGYFVDNQKKAFKSFKKLKLVFGEGDLRQITSHQLLKKLKELINLPNHQEYIDNQKKMIDGKQQKRHLDLIKGQLL